MRWGKEDSLERSEAGKGRGLGAEVRLGKGEGWGNVRHREKLGNFSLLLSILAYPDAINSTETKEMNNLFRSATLCCLWSAHKSSVSLQRSEGV